MAGKIVADTLEHSTAGSIATNYVVNGSAKAWAASLEADATIGDSLNVSSAVDDGAGFEQVIFASSFNSANYVSVGSLSRTTTETVRIVSFYERVSASIHVSTKTVSAGVSDQPKATSFHGDLA